MKNVPPQKQQKPLDKNHSGNDLKEPEDVSSTGLAIDKSDKPVKPKNNGSTKTMNSKNSPNVSAPLVVRNKFNNSL